jgi:hypothetical protein
MKLIVQRVFRVLPPDGFVQASFRSLADQPPSEIGEDRDHVGHRLAVGRAGVHLQVDGDQRPAVLGGGLQRPPVETLGRGASDWHRDASGPPLAGVPVRTE